VGSLIPRAGSILGSATLPWLESWIGNTTQYEKVSQSAGLITHAALGSTTNIGFRFDRKGSGNFAFGTVFNVDSFGNVLLGGGATIDSTSAYSIIMRATRYELGDAFTVIRRNAQSVFELSTNVAGQWASLKLGVSDAGTTNVANGLTVGHQSSGTPAAGFGAAVLFRLNSSSAVDQDAGQIAALWSTATHASRTSDLVFSAVNNAAALAEVARFKGNALFVQPQTVTAGGTTGDRTIDKPAGTVNIAAGNATITVTNALVTANSQVFAVIRTNDTTSQIKNIVPGAGSFVINLVSNATAETSIGFWVINN
jgi:hypothetical protein